MKTYLILIMIGFSSIHALAKPLVYIVKQQNLPAYNAAIDAITTELNADYELKVATVDRQTVDVLAKAIKKERPKLTISVGTKATKLLQTKLKREPILFTMVVRPDRTELVKN